MAAAVAPLRDVTVGQQASLVYAVGASMTASLGPLFEAAEAMPAVRDVSIAQTTLEDVFIQVRRPPGGGGAHGVAFARRSAQGGACVRGDDVGDATTGDGRLACH